MRAISSASQQGCSIVQGLAATKTQAHSSYAQAETWCSTLYVQYLQLRMQQLLQHHCASDGF
jgi:hypothetical protein